MLIITGRENVYCYMTVFFSGVIMHLSFNQTLYLHNAAIPRESMWLHEANF